MMPSPDTLAAILMAAVVLLAVWIICRTAPGAGPRYVQARRYHHAGLARHARTRASEAVTTPMPALATVPDIAPFVRTT